MKRNGAGETPGAITRLSGVQPGQAMRSSWEAYIGTQPSKGALKSIIGNIHDETAISMTRDAVERRIAELNSILRGWDATLIKGLCSSTIESRSVTLSAASDAGWSRSISGEVALGTAYARMHFYMES